MTFALCRRFGRLDITLVKPGRVDPSVGGNGERMHAMSDNKRAFAVNLCYIVVIDLYFSSKALAAICRT